MKKRLTKSLVAGLFLTAISIAACTKSHDLNLINDSHIAGIYKVTALHFIDHTGNQIDLFASLPQCQKDNLQKFFTNHTYQHTDACDPAENQTGRWQMISSQKITINGVSADLLSYDERSLTLSIPGFLGLPGVVTEILTRQ